MGLFDLFSNQNAQIPTGGLINGLAQNAQMNPYGLYAALGQIGQQMQPRPKGTQPGTLANMFSTLGAYGRGAIQGQDFSSKIDLRRLQAEALRKRMEMAGKPQPFTLGQGQTRFGPDGKPIASVEPEDDKPFTLGRGQTRFGPDGKPIASVEPEDDKPSIVQEYEYAKAQGYPHSLQRYVLDKKQAGAMVIKQFGQIPPGYRLRTHKNGSASMEPIPGSPAAAKAAQEERKRVKQEGAEAEMKASKAATMLDATARIKDEMKNSLTPVVGTASIPFALYSGSPAGRVRSYVNTLKSGIVLGAMIRLKNASSTGATGFGQMNRAELQVLIDDLGALDPNNTDPEIFLPTIKRIEAQYERVLNDIRRNVEPERLKQLGLDELVGSAEKPTSVPNEGWSVK